MFPATVDDFEMDRFEVTVGRFRKFVAAYSGRPAAGAGAHPRIEGSGWNPAWGEALPDTAPLPRDRFTCTGTLSTWTDSPGANENLPINCVRWPIAFAFCAWDGSRLPTEAEWNYAAAGGSEQRQYPWSTPPSSTMIDPSYAAYACLVNGMTSTCEFDDMLPVGARSPRGDGRWGHADLAGNMAEWALDTFLAYTNPCVDCAQLAPAPDRVSRGGGWNEDSSSQRTSNRGHHPQGDYSRVTGLRCVRSL
ncbi:formylglycine-generating enzyme family protein [Sorangium sp. So ce1151]|uniref:formylglycine-generating enzyme family protein n=1 Tax=Sorangium sp. So ce1151 TaxID=3133332 RepID=UPI003F5EB81A